MMRNRFQAGSPIVRNASGETEILVFGDIGESFWDDSGITAKGVKAQLDEAPAADTIVVRINSPGGDAFEGVAINNILRDDGRRIVVKVDGTAISSASIIAMAGDEIRMADNALMMIHDPWSCACGSADDMRSMADRLDKVGGALAQTYVSRTRKSKDDVLALMSDETWMSAEEALEEGFATHIDGASDDAEALLTEQKIAAYGNVPGSVSRWMRNGGQRTVVAFDITSAMDLQRIFSDVAATTGADVDDVAHAGSDLHEKFDVTTVPDMRAALTNLCPQGKRGIRDFINGNTTDGTIVPKTSPPADDERGGSTPTGENTVDLTEYKAALETANETITEANARADALDTQNGKLVDERDAARAELAEIADAKLVAKVEAMVGDKFPGTELEAQLALARKDEPLFDKLAEQRTSMTLLNKDPAKMGADPEPKPVTGADGSGLTTIVNAAAAAAKE